MLENLGPEHGATAGGGGIIGALLTYLGFKSKIDDLTKRVCTIEGGVVWNKEYVKGEELNKTRHDTVIREIETLRSDIIGRLDLIATKK
jgi:hypothetical protein